jgi:lipid-A-disaccharide synthase
MTLVILPCQYASGEEISLGLRTGVDRCVTLGEFRKLRGDPGEKNYIVKKKLLMHLGGDIMFSAYLSWKLGCRLWVYSSRPRWRRFVDRYFVPDETALGRFKRAGLAPERYVMIGNLALDSVTLSETEEETRDFLGLSPDEPVMTCLTGSRPLEYTESTKLMISTARIVTDRFPEIRTLFPLAPTVREELLQDELNKSGIKWIGESRIREIELGNGKKAAVVRDRTLEALNCSKLAIALPGTNNLQAAALYIPYIMVLPLHRADEYPLDGLPGILPLWIPGMKYLKKTYIIKLNERTSFLSLPNKIAGRMIAPEIRGFFDARVVARMAIGLLESPEKLKEISRTFWENTRDRGASVRLSEYVEKFAKEGTN